ncbi:MAG: DEAD/DEAH box helicase [Bacteroidetes bacterium]|nr:DEAD/DEAH box helicase [Bacteroidota bacterium]
MSFSSLGLSPSFLKTLSEQGYTEPYPIQEKAIPAILEGKDILAIAQTGSGKTASFALPILEKIQHEEPLKNRHVSVLVLVPTRELAAQVNEVFNLLADNLPRRINILAVYGGVSINPQMIRLQGVQILIATPGRLLELVDSKAVHLSDVKVLVLDEADKMLNLGFRDEMTRILSFLPSKKQNLLFSATLSEEVTHIEGLLLKDPVVIKIADDSEGNIELITQSAYHVSEERKGPLLRYLIKQNNLKQVLVFTSSVFKADAVANKLRNNGIDASAIHSKKSQGARQEALSKFKSGKLQVMVATDLMARGIDIKFLPCVVNYELPRSPKDYIHRIGRTGRAENAGMAISLISPEEEHHFKIIQKKMGKKVEINESESIDLHGY